MNDLLIHRILYESVPPLNDHNENSALDIQLAELIPLNEVDFGDDDNKSSEIVKRFNDTFSSWDIDEKFIHLLASHLCMDEVSLRSGDVFDKPLLSKAWIQYPNADEIRHLIPHINGARHYRSAALFSCVIYAMFLLAHPLTDGNGRTARTLVRGALHFKGIKCAVHLPLERAFAEERPALVKALQILGLKGDWQPLESAFAATLRKAIMKLKGSHGVELV